MKIDVEDYDTIRSHARYFVDRDSYTVEAMCRYLANQYATTIEEITAIFYGQPVPVRPMGPLPVVATYVER